MDPSQERKDVARGRILKVVWLDAFFELDVEEHPGACVVTTVGYELPASWVPPRHIGIAAEWLGGESFRAGTYIPESCVMHKEELK
jgi:hypothetical protein